MASGRASVVKSRSWVNGRPRMASRTLPPTRYRRWPAAAKRSARGAVASRSGCSRSGTMVTTTVPAPPPDPPQIWIWRAAATTSRPGPPVVGGSGSKVTPSRPATEAAADFVEHVEVVAALQEGDGAAGGRGQRHRPGQQPPVVAGRQGHAGQWVGPVGVEAEGHEHPRGGEALGHRPDDLVERGPVGVARGPGGEREVDGEALAVAGAGLLQPARARVEGRLVGRHVEDAAVGVEGVLGAVAVVDVPVEDRHPLTPIGEGRRAHGHVVEQAEAHGLGVGGVVAGGADDAEGGVGLAPVEAVDGVEAGAGREQGRVPRAGEGGGVVVDPTAALGHEPLEAPDELGPVDPGQLVEGGRPGLGPHHRARHRRRPHAGQHRVDPLGPLGMPAPGPVFLARRRALDQDGHRRRRLPPAPCRRVECARSHKSCGFLHIRLGADRPGAGPAGILDGTDDRHDRGPGVGPGAGPCRPVAR